MFDSLSIVFLQCLIALAGLIFLLFKKQTAYMGITLLFAFNVSTASLSAFFFGRLFGLREDWITPEHEKVFVYSGWAFLAMVAAVGLAWRPSKDQGADANRDLFPWITEKFVFFSLAIGSARHNRTGVPLRRPDGGHRVHLLSSWLKIGFIAAVILYKKIVTLGPLLIALFLYLPASIVAALSSGHSPVSLDAIVPIALVATCFNRVTIMSFLKLILWMIPCMYLMIGWMASRNMIRSGALDQFSMTDRAVRFGNAFVDELVHAKVTPYDIQDLIFLRIDMSDILAQEMVFENTASGEDDFAYGGTLIEWTYMRSCRERSGKINRRRGLRRFCWSTYTGTSR